MKQHLVIPIFYKKIIKQSQQKQRHPISLFLQELLALDHLVSEMIKDE